MQAAIDFGISNTDIVVEIDGEGAGEIRHWMQPYDGEPTAATVRALLHAEGIALGDLSCLAVTGGHHRALPETLDGCPLVTVNEVEAIARGGVALADLPTPETPLLVVSAGSGVAMIAVSSGEFAHATGSGVGGGTLLGLSKLLLGVTDPVELNIMASQGDANRVDLALQDVVSGPIGSLPPDTTAVNFGRVLRLAKPAAENDMAAAIVTLVSQVIGTIAVNAARAQGIEHVVVTGHLTDMSTVRMQIGHVGRFFGLPLQTPVGAGKATALGALRSMQTIR